ncbi:nucleolar transcription factor 1-B-like isoform X2 [Morone saxatilis]|uniref:nucleolar transcription factor 1-B-like isoform X2 n=1 Tax=Morone saxatilis TaxID=34816 RepID=UPI0015E1D664|nr:nucleolar transcription factor 1-B-like isoform X2 [Morone saxatilis]
MLNSFRESESSSLRPATGNNNYFCSLSGKMKGNNTEDETSDWTKANLQKLYAAMKTGIPERDRMSEYTEGLKAIDWQKVAFPPFSPQACRGKWMEILQEMRKTRTLTELLVEAEDSLSSPGQTEDVKSLPTKPPFNGYNLFCKEQVSSMAGVKKNDYVSKWAQRWRDLTEKQRDEYSTRCKELKRQYSIKLDKYLMTFDEKEQQQIINKHGIKRPKVIKRQVTRVKKLPGEPKMPAQSSNSLFCKDQMALLKRKYPNAKERFIKANQIWKNLTNTEKQRYNVKVKENLKKYTMELQKWFKTLKPAEQKQYRMCNRSKRKYLDATVYYIKEESLDRPSDSEDEDMEDSSDDEEEAECEEDDKEEGEEEELGDDMFEMY